MKFAVSSIAAFVALGCLVEPGQALRRRRRLLQTTENQAAVNELIQRGDLEEEIEYHGSRQLQGDVPQTLTNALPVQTFYIPLPEISMFTQVFYQINSEKARPPIESMVSMAISTDQTIIWYDHWEDGYDANVAVGTGPTTEIWGDGDASNGCPPDVNPCTNSNDRLMAGDSVVIQNTVALPRNPEHIRYDGSDRVQASFPIAVTRGGYPAQPGSLMAGAVEVLDQDTWGLTFEAPIGADVGKSYTAFSLSMFFFMASEDRTKVTLANGYVVTLNQGQGAAISVNIGQQIRSNKPIQVDLITGDRDSYYELRWYSMLPLEQYSTQYYSPVGDTFGKTKNLIYNPGPDTTQIAIHYRAEGTNQTRYVGGYLGANQATFSPVNPTGSGMAITASSPIIALSLTDTEYTVSNGDATGGQFYDWGFPVVPIPDLTSQVLIGWGYGCTNNNCYGQEDRSVVWVSPIRDADVYIDYNNQGTNYETHFIQQLQSMKFRDKGDHDMSGAIIFATEPGSGPSGNTVPIAAAWGQDPAVSKEYQSISLDLGTTVPPMQEITASKLVDLHSAYPGDVLTYTIRTMNLGQRILQPNLATVKDELGEYIEYIEGSTFYSSYTEGLGLTQMQDDSSGTKFPLDGEGYVIPFALSRRGGICDITFKVKVAGIDNIKQLPVVNSGILTSPMITKDQGFTARTDILFDPALKIENTVYVGADSGASCESKGVELAQGVHGSSVAYCFKITNTGKSYLKDIYLTNGDLSYESSVSSFMAPGDSVIVVTGGFILSDLQNTATVTAVPVLKDGTVIEDYDTIEDSDPSAVGKVTYLGALTVENTVHLGHDDGAKCSTDQTFEKVEGIAGSPVTYCFTMKNTGDTYLNGMALSNPALQYSKSFSGVLAPGESASVFVEKELIGSLKNVASVTATPVLENGSSVGLGEVTVTDPSEVEKLVLHASVVVENTVYPGHDSGAKCGSKDAVEFVGDFAGTDVTYCMEIINTGQTYLDGLKVDNADIQYHEHSNIPNLGPNEKHMLFVEREITKSLVNSASVVGNPVFGDGRDLVDLEDVADTDPSEVALLAHEPSISVTATAYAGSDSGSSCGTSRAKNSVEDFIGTAVVYCFTFHNTGNTHLTDIKLVNDDLSFDDAIPGNFAPGSAHTVTLTSAIPSALSSTVVVSAHPVNDDGEAITGSADVNASDDVHVTGLQYLPSVSIANTVYFGEENAGDCDAKGVEFAEAEIGSSAVFCWKITNTGNTHLKSVSVRNDVLGFEKKDVLASVLPPGASFTYTTARTVTRREQNIVHVLAEPSNALGADLPHQDVSDSDPSEVSPTPMNPSVTIENTVYSGADSGAQCGSGVGADKVEDIFKTDIQYCFVLKNSGDTYLSNIKVVNDDLAYVNDAVSAVPIAPGDSITVSLPSKLLESFSNLAVVSGTPCWKSGVDECPVIPDYEDVTHSDSSEVEKLKFDVGVTIENTILLGAHTGILGREKCPGEEYVEDYPGSDISYCMQVTNTGNSHLGELKLASKKIVYFKSLDELLAPGDSVIVAVPTEITGSMETIANVTATPFSSDGRKILDHAIVTDFDAASVGMLDLSPSITISNKVYLGDDDGASCGTNVAVDRVEESFGEVVTYCFIVTNDGDAHLATVTIEDEALSFRDVSIEQLAPGESVTVSLPATIAATLTNTAIVTAKPVLESGKDIGMDPVSFSDTSEVKEIAFQPSINVQTKVYVGDEGEDKCGDAEEHVEGIAGTIITYCMTLTNTGDSHLSGSQLEIASLAYSISVDGTLAPGESKSIAYKMPIEDTAVATASVTSNPTLEDGTDIPSAEVVTSSDPANHELIPYSPSVHIDNLVYVGDEGESKCQLARDFVEGPYGESIIYCFTITNTGNTPLGKPIILTDDVLGVSQSVDALLAPGATITITVPGRIEGDTTNVVTVVANPLQLDGSDIAGLSDVESSDPSTASQFDYVGNVRIDNTVYLGDDQGSKCGSDDAVEIVQGVYGSQATYCFVVTNTGDTYLSDITIVDEKLSFTEQDFGILEPGASATKFFVQPITGDILNYAVVSATPTNAKGEVIPNLETVTNEDPSEVEKKKHSPKITITNTVYLGIDDGAKCGSTEAVEYVADKYGEIVTYCFVVANTGDTTLDDIVIENSALDFSYSDIPPLTPNSTATISYTNPIHGPKTNDVSVSANPVLPDLADIPDLEDVTATDPSEVGITMHNPSINVENKVYVGSAEDNLCGTDSAKEYVEGVQGASVTYCFEIENNGDSVLSNIVLANPDLDFSKDDIGQLSPGSVATIALTTSINGYLKNTVKVTGVPTLSDGSPIPDAAVVDDSDPSAVGQSFGLGSLGDQLGSTGTDIGGDLGEISNLGGSLGGDIPNLSGELGGDMPDLSGELVGDITDLSGDLTDGGNTQDTTLGYTPGLDTSNTDIGTTPAIFIENTVYAGKDLGLACPGGELVEDAIGVPVVYCFLVKNTGDTFLYNIELTDEALDNYEDNSISSLAPGASDYITVQSEIATNLVNTAVVRGQPGLAGGIIFNNVPEVSASDSSEVKKLVDSDVRFTDKSPFTPPSTTPDECIQDKYDGTDKLICATRTVFLESVIADNAASCTADGTTSITISVEGAITMTQGVNDLGWYVATDGGDAMTGSCVINGLQEGNPYDVEGEPNVAAGSVVWTNGGGDGDECGDVIIDAPSGGSITTPIAVELSVPCKDSNEDGTLDFALCFSWSNDNTNGCSISANAPAASSGECYCARYEIPNIAVTTPDEDPVTVC